MQLKTILNRMQKFKSFVYKSVRWAGSPESPELEVRGSNPGRREMVLTPKRYLLTEAVRCPQYIGVNAANYHAGGAYGYETIIRCRDGAESHPDLVGQNGPIRTSWLGNSGMHIKITRQEVGRHETNSNPTIPTQGINQGNPSW